MATRDGSAHRLAISVLTGWVFAVGQAQNAPVIPLGDEAVAGGAPPARLAIAPKGGQEPRFELAKPLPMLPSVTLDMRLYGQGLANQTARAKRLQARILWIDCTANIDRYNTEEKIVALIAKARDSGFNTIVFDVKPISGQVAYESRFAEKLLEWKGKKLPREFDPLRVMAREAKAAGLWFFVSLNAFSEGHRDFKVGPGYAWPDRQTILYEPQPIARIGTRWMPIEPKPNAPFAESANLQIYTDPAKLPAPAEGRFAVSIGKDGSVVDGFEFGGAGSNAPTIPTGGCAIVAFGQGAAFLRAEAWPGRKISFESNPVYVPIQERPEQQIPLMMNPNHPQNRQRALAIVRELVSNYPIDGIVYDDRLRYAGLNADFSSISMRLFEEYVGKRLRWPDDVFRYVYTPNFTRGISAGPFYQSWLTWRASTLQDFVLQVREAIHAVNPKVQFGVYAGSWYGEYSNFGANYGAPELDAGFWYLTPRYRKTGFAPLLDFLITGCYYNVATIHQAMASSSPLGYTVEYAGYLSSQVARDQTWTYAGIMLSQFQNDPEGLMRALQAACGSTQGVMVFDLSHDIEPFWPLFERAFSDRLPPPHARPDLLQELRRRRILLDKEIWKRDSVVITAGQIGAGH